MVGIVIVAHSRELAEGVRDLAAQMSARRNLPIAAAGGLEDGSLGTSLDRIRQAVDAVYGEDGVLVLMDLGSAVMTAQMLLEMLPPDRQAHVRLSHGPLVEGAIAAAVAAAQGEDLDGVQRAADAAASYPKLPREAEPAPGVATSAALPTCSAELVVPNPVGLHARPAGAFVQLAARYSSRITVQNLSQRRPPADAKSMLEVASVGTARQGERIRIVAQGDDAWEALVALSTLVRSGFGELEGVPSAAAPPYTATPEGHASVRLQGIAASPGYAVAPVFFLGTAQPLVARRGIDDPERELARLKAAVEEAKCQLEGIRDRVAQADAEVARIFDFHRLMLEDPSLMRDVEQLITAQRISAEAAVADSLAAWAERFSGLDDPLMRSRAADVRDLGSRLLRILEGGDTVPQGPTAPAIVVAEDLSPSATALLDRSVVRGIATASGGANSHTAILARLWGIPAVVGLGRSILTVPADTMLVLDGTAGIVEVNPAPEVVRAYREREETLGVQQLRLRERALEPAVTRDGRVIPIMANIDDVPAVEEALRNGAEGIGLLRSEFLYLQRAAPPDEEEQYAAYRCIAEALGRRPLIVRTLDVGGDKDLPYLRRDPEPNPSLGVRGLRLSLECPDLFLPQLRAILRAAAGHDVRIMFPMIASREEVVRAKQALAEARRHLEAAGCTCPEGVRVGIMIETPAAAVCAERLAAEVDFFSIGSNDLTQYTLACDRTNERVSALYQPLHPAVLRLIHMVTVAGHAAGKRVGLCGELAGERLGIPVLLGLGLDELSMVPRAIPAAKDLIRRLDLERTRELASEVLELSSAAEVEARVTDFLSML